MKALILQMPVLAFLVGGPCASSVRADVESLPDGYVRLQCVNPGIAISQWVDTGYTPDSTDRIEMKIKFNVATRTSSTCLWSARDASFGNAVCLFWEGASVKKLTVQRGNASAGQAQGAVNFSNNVMYEFIEDMKESKFYLNGDVFAESLGSVAFEKAGSQLTIFANRTGGTVTAPTYATYSLYSFKVFDGDGNPKVNLVPAFESLTGIAGLYDTVRGQFITASGSGDNKTLAYKAGDAFGDGLPPNYRKLKWVKPTGKQHLLTFIRPNATDSIELKTHFERLDVNFDFWCARSSSYTDSMLFAYNGGKLNVFRGGSSANQTTPTYFNTEDVFMLRADYKEKMFYVNGEEKLALGNATFTGNQAGSDLTLYVSCYGTTVGTANLCDGNYRTYGFKITDEDGVDRMNLVPCLEKASGNAGLFDTVQGQFLTANGVANTPSFTYDTSDTSVDEVPVGYTEQEWVRAPGSQWIFTDYIPSGDDRIEMKLRLTPGLADHSAPLWCARAADGSDMVDCFFDENNGNHGGFPSLTFDCSLRTVSAFTYDTETDYLIVMDCANRVGLVNGVRWTALTDENPTFTAGGKLSLFAAHLAGNNLSPETTVSPSSVGRYRIYSFKVIGSDGVARLNLVPCVRDADNAVGFYDLARDRFLPFIGAGAEAGTDVGNRWTVGPKVEPLAWTEGASETGRITLGAALHGSVSCDHTDADLAALGPGDHEVVFSVVGVETGMELSKTVTVSVAEQPVTPVYPSAPFALTGFSRRTRTVKMGFGGSAEPRQVYLAWGEKDAGAKFTDYTTNVCKLCDVPAGTTSAQAVIPETAFAAMTEGGFRLFLSGERPLSSDYAAMDDLVVQYDAIDNAGRGVHEKHPSAWKNLAADGTCDYLLENGDLVEANCVRPANLARFAEGSVFDGYVSATIEADALPVWYSSDSQRPLVGIPTIGRICLDGGHSGGLTIARPQSVGGVSWMDRYSSGFGNLGQLVSKKVYHTYSAVPRLGKTVDASDVYVDGVVAAPQSGSQGWAYNDPFAGSGKLQLGWSMLLSCFHSVRVYGRELSASEVAWNARVDAERFRGADRMIRAEVTGFCKVNGGFAVLVR